MSAPLLDYIESSRRMEEGKMLAATAGDDWLQLARVTAERLGKLQRTVTINDVYLKVGLPPKKHRNAAGSVFLRKAWDFIDYDRSARAERHKGIIGVWSLKINDGQN